MSMRDQLSWKQSKPRDRGARRRGDEREERARVRSERSRGKEAEKAGVAVTVPALFIE
jgi:hypothetical protein